MSRLGTLDERDLSDEQRRLRDAITTGPRGQSAASGGPFEVWLHSPDFGEQAQRFGAYVRYETSLGARISEFAILICARHWGADYEWFVHAPIARQAGVPADAIEDLRLGRDVHLTDDTDRAVHGFCRELLGQRRVCDATYATAERRLGKSALVELVGLLGYYSLVALTLIAFEVLPPDSARPLE
jgi:4-carboxymuconolactone decarboxylase